MTPTMELRFVERLVPVESLGTAPLVHTVRVLQQKWVGAKEDSPGVFMPTQEWRDVPLVKEEV